MLAIVMAVRIMSASSPASIFVWRGAAARWRWIRMDGAPRRRRLSGERDSALGMSRRWRAERSAREGTGKGEGGRERKSE